VIKVKMKIGSRVISHFRLEKDKIIMFETNKETKFMKKSDRFPYLILHMIRSFLNVGST
jgi:hypothetical protein